MILPLTLALIIVSVASASAQPVARASRAAGPAAKLSALPRTADGRPDLQGTWDFAQLTPLERPGEFAGKDTITEEEAEQFAQRRVETTHKDRRDGGATVDIGAPTTISGGISGPGSQRSPRSSSIRPTAAFRR